MSGADIFTIAVIYRQRKKVENKKDRKIALSTSSRGRANGKITRKERKIALIILYLLYLFYV